MSGPFGVHMVMISGQKGSGELVTAAASFLSMAFFSVNPICTDNNVREEFLDALKVFNHRERLYLRDDPRYYTKNLNLVGGNFSTHSFFWLALDEEGYSLAGEILTAKGEDPDKRVYETYRKLNRFEHSLRPMPDVRESLVWWRDFGGKFLPSLKNDPKMKVKEAYRLFASRENQMKPAENEFYAWFKNFYSNLIPWQTTIKNIQSDLS